MLNWLKPNPLVLKRLYKFYQIKRGFYSLMILVVATFVSLFSEYIANNRPIVMYYEGEYYFPTWTFQSMEDFNQEDEWGFTDAEVEYRRLKDEWKDTENWVLMPPIPYNPVENDFTYEKNHPNPPDEKHLLGTDTTGRDVAARLLYGFRISMLFSLALVICAQTIGIIIGSIQGYVGGWFDILSQRFIEVWSSLPFLYVVMLMATIFMPNIYMLLFLMVLFQWISITYYMRTEMYREKARDYCQAVRALGASHLRVIFRHLLPNCLTPVVTFTPFFIVGGISALTALDFLGYGLPAPTPSWGELIDQAMMSSNRDKLWLTLSPFTALTVTLILVTFVGEAVREAFDPKKFAKYQ